MRPTRRHIRSAGLLLLLLGLGGGWWYRATRPAYRLRRGQAAARAGDFVEAEEYAKRLEAAGARDHFQLLKGEIALRQNAPVMALAYLNEVQDRGGLRVEAAVLSARSLIALRQPRAAEGYLLFVLERNPDHVDAHRWLATIYYDQGDNTLALNHLSRVAQLDAADGRPHRLIGLILKDQNDYDGAEAAYRESLRRDPHPGDENDLRVELADCLLKQSKDAEVLEALRGVDTPAAAGARAEAMIRLGRETEADDLLDGALRRHPDDVGLLRLKGERLLTAGKPDPAAKLLEQVVAKSNDDYRARNQLALAYERLGRTADAAEQQRKVRQIQATIAQIDEKNRQALDDPWDPQVRHQLAALFDSIGRKEMALMWRRAAQACEARPR